MDKLAQLSTGAKIVLGGAIVFLIISFFNWQEVDLGPIGSAGVSMWDGIGWIAGLLAIALIVWLALRLADVNLEIGLSPALITAGLSALLLIFTIIKFLADNEYRTFWAWLGLILAVVIGVGAWLNMQAAGESVGEAFARFGGGSSTATTTTTTTTAPPPPPPATPPSASTPPPPPPPTSAEEPPPEERA